MPTTKPSKALMRLREKRGLCIRCGVGINRYPYHSAINGICMECHRECLTFWGLMDMLNEEIGQ